MFERECPEDRPGGEAAFADGARFGDVGSSGDERVQEPQGLAACGKQLGVELCDGVAGRHAADGTALGEGINGAGAHDRETAHKRGRCAPDSRPKVCGARSAAGAEELVEHFVCGRREVGA